MRSRTRPGTRYSALPSVRSPTGGTCGGTSSPRRLRFISDATQAIHDTFVELDQHMTAQIAQIGVPEN